MTKASYVFPLMGPTMRFHLCDNLLSEGEYFDTRGRKLHQIAKVRCTLPRDHDGPCCLAHYNSLQYPSDT